MNYIAPLVLLVALQVSGSYVTREKFGEQKFNDYTVRNNIWGNGAGNQEMTATDGSHFCLKCSHGSTGGIKSYPHSGHFINKPISQVHTLTSTYAAKVDEKPGVLAYSFTYDIWLQKHKYEIMIWLDQRGQVGPIGGPCAQNVKVGGLTWKSIHKGSNGSNQVFSFINHDPAPHGKIDLKAIIDYCDKQKWFDEGPATFLEEIQLGFEITSTPPDTSFCLTGFTVACT